MKRNFFISIFLALALIISCAKKENLTSESFKAELDSALTEAAAIGVCQKYIEGAQDMELVLQAYKTYQDYDDKGLKEFIQKQYSRHAKSPKYAYLAGKSSDDPLQAIALGRKLIAKKPGWQYGYRLLMSAYANSLFAEKGEAAILEKLKTMLPEDERHFKKALNVDTDRAVPLGYAEELCLYKKDYFRALELLEEGKKLGADWATGLNEAKSYALAGKFDKIQPVVEKYVEERIAVGKIDSAKKVEYLKYYQIKALRSAKAYGQLIDFIKSQPGWKDNPEDLYDIACCYTLMGGVDDAFKHLDMAADKGWNKVTHTLSDDDLKALWGMPRWDKAIQKIKDNWVKGLKELRKEALAAKLALPAPEWALPDAKGDTVRLADLRGKIAVLDFWATWCAPCRKAMPEIDQFTRGLTGDDIRVFSINVWEKGKSKALDFMKEKGYSMTLLFGSDELTKSYGVQGIPTIFVIDKYGIIRYKEVGYEEGLKEKLTWWTEDLLKGGK